jgi:hypothetical protein
MFNRLAEPGAGVLGELMDGPEAEDGEGAGKE